MLHKKKEKAILIVVDYYNDCIHAGSLHSLDCAGTKNHTSPINRLEITTQASHSISNKVSGNQATPRSALSQNNPNLFM